MRITGSLVVLCLWFGVGLASSPAGAHELNSGLGSLTGALVVPPATPLLGAGQYEAGREALLASPEAVSARARSEVEFERLDHEQADQEDTRAFLGLLANPNGGTPRLPRDAVVTGYEAPGIASVVLGHGSHGLILSGTPLAVQSSSGVWSAINLSLRGSAGALVPVEPLVPVRIPTELRRGAQLSAAGMSLTPVAQDGMPLSGEAVANGVSAFYAETETDADTILKPSTLGLEETTVLRSMASPEELRFRVGLSRGERLQQDGSRGVVKVLRGTRTLGVFPVPSAYDAAGTPVPTSMSLSGTTLVVSVAHRKGSYLYPIEADPEYQSVVESKGPTNEKHEDENWVPVQGGGYTFSTSGEGMAITHKGTWPAGDEGELVFETLGYTKIWKLEGDPHVFPSTKPWLEGALFIGGKGEATRELPFGSYSGEDHLTLCANSAECSANGVAEHNWGGMYVTTGVASTELSKGEQELGFGGNAAWMKVYIAQERGDHSKPETYTGDTYLEWEAEGKKEKQLNSIGANEWLSPEQGAIELMASDGGLGVSQMEWQFKKPTEEWPHSPSTDGKVSYLTTPSCKGVECSSGEHQDYSYNTLNKSGKVLPEGELDIRPAANSAMPESQGVGSEHVLKVDAQAPEHITISGLKSLPQRPVYMLGEVEAHLKVEATDGEGTTLSSGVASITVAINGHELQGAGGSCTPGPCTASHEWSVNGAELGSGVFNLEVIAKDYAGNKREQSFELEVYHASPVAMGPGSVNPESGDFALEATDAELSGAMGSLAVTRHYDSLNLGEGGQEGPVGPQWSLGLGSLARLEVLPDGSVMVLGPNGATHFNTKEGGGFEGPEGDKSLTLEHLSEAYVLKDATQDTTTEFRKWPVSPTVFYPVVSQGPVAADTTSDEYEEIEAHNPALAVVVPEFELEPHPNTTCTHAQIEKLEIAAKGCRALEFRYDTGNTENEFSTPWGEYKSRLKEVIAVAYSRASGKMAAVAVAKYLYDTQGRLRAEWNPSISPALKTTYGYDSEGHVTALTPPGQDSWTFTYGTIPSDPKTGRLLKAYRSHSLWEGAQPSNTEAPKVSGGVLVGNTLAVSNGVWSGGPVAYGYQWEACKASGKECASILGATNPNYTPTLSQAGEFLRAAVTAINGGGAVTADSASSEEVTRVRTPTYTSSVKSWEEGGTKGFIEPVAATVGSGGDVWVLDKGAHAIEEFSPEGAHIRTFSEQGLEPQAITVDPHGHIWISDDNSEHPRIEEYSETGGLIKTVAAPTNPAGPPTVPAGITADAAGHIWLEDSGRAEIVEFSEEGAIVREFAGDAVPSHIAIDKSGHVWVLGASKKGEAPDIVREFSETGTLIREFNGPGGTKPESGSAIEVDAAGDVWISDPQTPLVDVYSETGELLTHFGTKGTGAGQLERPSAVALSGTGTVWITDSHNLVLQKWTQENTGKGSTISPQPGVTVDYEVPLEGAAAPDQLGTNTQTGKPEPETWGQSDDPVQATAVFAPSEPQSWPATHYTQATIVYMDSRARTVNQADPAGGVSTEEYNEENEVTRSLSADNRATALKEANPAAEAALLDSKNLYNSEGLLTESWGPQHTVRLAHGKYEPNEKTLARAHTINYYNEGAKAVEQEKKEQYNLLTKTTTGAETQNKEEFDKRTAAKSYSGQSNLGWTLRKPTSVTIDPGGLNLTTTTRYEASTGNTLETQTPAAANGPVAPAYSSAFGTAGKGTGQFNTAAAVAVTNSGNIDALDSNNSRVEEFTPSGTYISTFGAPGKGNGELTSPLAMAEDSKGNLWVADSGNNRIEEFNTKNEYASQFGEGGTAEKQFASPSGIAVSPKTGDIFVTDYGNNRVQKFGPKGEFLAAFGFGVTNGENKLQTCTSKCRTGLSGSGSGELNGPRGIAVSSTGEVWVADSADSRLEEYNEEGTIGYIVGSNGTGNEQFSQPQGMTIDSTGHLWVTDGLLDRIQEFEVSPTRPPVYMTQFASKGTGNGQLEAPLGVATTSAGKLYIADSANNRVEIWLPTITGNPAAYETKTTYYTAKGESEVEACREHIEYAGLPCQTAPVAQPGAGTQELPVTTLTYNMWNQVETTTETAGTATRTKKTTFEESGRPKTSEEKATQKPEEKPINEQLPLVTDTYNGTNGTLEKQSTTVGKTTETTISQYNALGEMTSYTDSSGNTALYEYEPTGDYRLTHMDDGEGWQTYTYEPTTGELTELTDSAAKTFKATYDVEGHLLTESYPNGMTAYRYYNPVGAATSLEYKKETHCAENCVWFSDSITPSIHGETMQQTSTLTEEPSYTYDNAGRLTAVQEAPAGEGCKTRLYNYDENNDRTSLTQREPDTGGKCATEGGTTEWHTYDTAGRLTDPGVTYEPFGNTTTLPAADAGGHAITSSYYVSGQVYTQTQNGTSTEYLLDPQGRTRETIPNGNGTEAKMLHYDDAGTVAAWTSEPNGDWQRDIPGMGGNLTAIQAGAGATGKEAILQLSDLNGNIVATASLSETATKLASTYNSTEFGVPTTNKPPEFAWLGADWVSSTPADGTVTEDGVTYVPQTGKPLQTDGVEVVNPVFEGTAYRHVISNQAVEGAIAAASRGAARAMEAFAASGCNEETEGCGPDPEHGPNPWGCKVWVSWGHYFNNELGVHGHWRCAEAPADIEVEIALLRIVKGSYELEFERVHVWHYPGELGATGSEYYYHEACYEGDEYQAWVWGRTWNEWSKETNWYASAIDGHPEMCPGASADPGAEPEPSDS